MRGRSVTEMGGVPVQRLVIELRWAEWRIAEIVALGRFDTSPMGTPWGRSHGGVMIVLGAILLIIGLVAGISILTTIGGILLVVGLVLTILGAVGRPIAGRKTFY